MSEMVERVARAIYAKLESYPSYALRQPNGVIADELAAVAFDALMEPTPEMIEAGNIPGWDDVVSVGLAEQIYRAMIIKAKGT